MLENGQTDNTMERHPDFQSLHLGCEGGIVLMVQNSLNRLGYTLEKNAIFSKEMENAIIKFQEEHNITANGVVDYQTMTILDQDFMAST